MHNSSKQLTIASPAKINLHLAVLDRRQDGFHNLESIFLAVDFGDTLYFEFVDGEKTLEITMEGPAAAGFSLPVEKNIIFRTLSLFREKTDFNQGLRVKVEKYIPPGGGLGGGSSNAASTLLALNKLAGFPFSHDELLEMSAVLGSDVPFFTRETTAALVTGRGEFIESLEAPSWFFVLVNPGFPSDTAAAFRLLDEARSQLSANRRELDDVNQLFVKACESSLLDIPDSFFNDFLPVFPNPEKSVYDSIMSQLRELGADFANLSGAGSTCFGVFREKLQAEKAAAALRGTWSFVECCTVR